MKTGRISKVEEQYISENIHVPYAKVASELDRNPDSILDFIKRKVAEGKLEKPKWLEGQDEEQAKYDLSFRPYWKELEQQFTNEELELFKYHWSRIISQFQDDVIPTEELQVVDLIKHFVRFWRNYPTQASFIADRVGHYNLREISAVQLGNVTGGYGDFDLFIRHFRDQFFCT